MLVPNGDLDGFIRRHGDVWAQMPSGYTFHTQATYMNQFVIDVSGPGSLVYHIGSGRYSFEDEAAYSSEAQTRFCESTEQFNQYI